MGDGGRNAGSTDQLQQQNILQRYGFFPGFANNSNPSILHTVVTDVEYVLKVRCMNCWTASASELMAQFIAHI